MQIRAAQPADASVIAAILRAEIEHGHAHFGVRPPSAASVRAQLERISPHRTLVSVQDGAVLGFASSGPWKERGGYAWTAEIGVYVALGQQGGGVGKALVRALVAALREDGFRTLLAGVAMPNPACVALLEGLGFSPAGLIPHNGHKNGAWWPVGYWSLHLGDGVPPGPPPTSRGVIRELPFVQVDAFAGRPFEGNPAAVIRLPHWLPDPVLAAIAAENNLSETAFLVGEPPDKVALRWFTPTVEVDLCGHATLAAGFVVLQDDAVDAVRFATRSGILAVTRGAGGLLELALPAIPPGASGLPDMVRAALGAAPVTGRAIRSVHHAEYWLAVFETAGQVRALSPDFGRLRALNCNVVCTAPGDGDLDFVSRVFAPASGIDEDPVTGSAHATLTPYWAERLGKGTLTARQVGPRGGALRCALVGDRVILGGTAVEVIRGVMKLPEPESP